QAWHNDGELIAAQPRHHLTVIQEAGDALGHRLQRPVARRVPEQIVDLLEAVEIEAQHGEPLARLQRRFDLLIELLVEGAAVREPREGVVVSKKQNIPLGFLAGPQIADCDGAMRLAAQIDYALDGLDRYFRAAGIEQDRFNELVLALEQPHARIRIGKILLQPRADDAVGGSTADEGHEIVVDGLDRLAIVDQQALDRGIGEAAHPIGFKLLPPAVADFECDAAERQNDDDKAGERNRDSEQA